MYSGQLRTTLPFPAAAMAANVSDGTVFINEVRAGITGLQNAFAQMSRRVADIERASASHGNNLQTLHQDIRAHEAIHDPYIAKVDAMERGMQDMNFGALRTRLDGMEAGLGAINVKINNELESLKKQLNERIPIVEGKIEGLNNIIPNALNIVDNTVTRIENEIGTMITEIATLKINVQDLAVSQGSGSNAADITGQADLIMNVANRTTLMEKRTANLEDQIVLAHDAVQKNSYSIEQMKQTVQSGGLTATPPGLGAIGKAHNLAELKSSRPSEGDFDGNRDNYDEFRKTTISWASAHYPDVEMYLAWAEDQTTPITPDSVEGAGLGPLAVNFHKQFRRELWSFLKPKSEARDIINDCGVGDGLEAWRLLKCLCRPQSGHRAVIDVKSLVNPAQAREVALVPSALAKWESAIREYVSKRQGSDPMADLGMKKVVATGIFPEEMAYDFTKELHKYATWAEFKADVLDYVDRMSRVGSRASPGQRVHRPAQRHNDAMDVGALGGKADPWSQGSDPWGMGAIGKGQGKQNGQGYQGTQPGKGGKGDGKCFNCGGNHFQRDCPKLGKGKGKGQKGRKGWGLCREYQRTGKCPRGDNCQWAHADVPKNLKSINNLCLEDLGDVTEKDGVYHPNHPDSIDAVKLLAQVSEEMDEVQRELAQVSEEEGWSQAPVNSSFTGPPQA